MITIKNLFKKYGEKYAVDDVSLTIEKGKVTSFIGPNGAGKSTVFNIMARLIAKESGSVCFYENEVTNWKSGELSKKLAILKQDNNLYLKLTVNELVGFGRFPHSKGNLTKEDHEKIDEAIAYMELEEFKDRFLDELSGGQRQRAYIAMVIAQDTEYILLDEPLNNLDVKHAVRMMHTIRKLCDELGRTVILVMHDINFASCYSDNIIAFKEGKIIANGKVNEVITEKVLEDLYEMPFDIEMINSQRICVYY